MNPPVEYRYTPGAPGTGWPEGPRTPGLSEVFNHPHGPNEWQVRYWFRKGLVTRERIRKYADPIPEDVQRRLIEMARLCAALKLPSRVAAKLSEEGTVGPGGQRVIPAGPGVTIILDPVEEGQGEVQCSAPNRTPLPAGRTLRPSLRVVN